MKTYLNYLTVSSSEHISYDNINTKAKEMLKHLKEKIRENKTKQEGLDLIYVIEESEYKLPREKTTEKAETKWEAFARKKGIRKKKKGTLVYDEELRKYVPRFGPYSKKNLILKSALVEGEKSFNELKKEKLDRIRKNRENQLENKLKNK